MLLLRRSSTPRTSVALLMRLMFLQLVSCLRAKWITQPTLKCMKCKEPNWENLDYGKLRRNYGKLRRNYAKLRRNYAKLRRRVFLHFCDMFPSCMHSSCHCYILLPSLEACWPNDLEFAIKVVSIRNKLVQSGNGNLVGPPEPWRTKPYRNTAKCYKVALRHFQQELLKWCVCFQLARAMYCKEGKAAAHVTHLASSDHKPQSLKIRSLSPKL